MQVRLLLPNNLEKMSSEELVSLYKENKKKIRENCKEIEKLKVQLKSTE